MRAGLFLLLPVMASAQTLTPTLLTPLNTALNETSGLLYVNGEVWTHLDSGNGTELYRLDPGNGDVLRQVTVSNASNVDWEDMASDGSWLYIADVGNNSGARTDLRVYRVALDSLLDPDVVSVVADTIRFIYSDQIDFTPGPQANNWDCEALIVKDDSLFLFTKRWLDSRTVLYAVPAAPGIHSAVRRDSLDAQGLITGAAFDPVNGSVALIGYTNGLFVPFVWELSGFVGNAFFSASSVRRPLSLAFVQTEGIAWNDASAVLISNEQSPFSAARLWELQLGLATGSSAFANEDLLIVPNPAASTVRVEGGIPGQRVRLLDLTGRVIREGVVDERGEIDLHQPADGMYLLELVGNAHLRLMPLVIKGDR